MGYKYASRWGRKGSKGMQAAKGGPQLTVITKQNLGHLQRGPQASMGSPPMERLHLTRDTLSRGQ